MNLTIGEVLIVISQVVPILQRDGLLDTTGTFTSPTPTQIAAIVSEVEAVLVRDGLIVPERVTRVIAALPLLFQLAGL